MRIIILDNERIAARQGEAMDSKKAYKFQMSDLTGYARPSSYELIGRSIKLEFNSGRRTTLTLTAEDGSITLNITDREETAAVLCQKIGGEIFTIIYAAGNLGMVYILDTATGFAAHLEVGGDEPIEDFGCIIAGLHSKPDSATDRQCTRSDDLDGNTIAWTFSDDITARLRYTKGRTAVTMPDTLPFSLVDCRVLRLASGIYFQYSQAELGPIRAVVMLAMDFKTMLIDGAMIGVPNLQHLAPVGGSGRLVIE